MTQTVAQTRELIAITARETKSASARLSMARMASGPLARLTDECKALWREYHDAGAPAGIWPKPTRCRDCALYNLEAVLNKVGRVMGNKAARCNWVSTETFPKSVPSWQTRVTATYMEPNDGEGCPCFVEREK